MIDGRGRVFGRVNLIDGIVAVLALGVIPLVYGGFRMFREPVPTITSIAPNQIAEHQPATLVITGENIRPFIEVSFGHMSSVGYFVQGPTRAEVKVPDLPAGTYDITFRDHDRVLLTKPAALTVVGTAMSPEADVQAIGNFVGLDDAEARSIGVGLTFGPQNGRPPVAEVLAARAPVPATQQVKVTGYFSVTARDPGKVRVQAIIRLHCVLTNVECRVGESAVARNKLIMLPLSAGSKSLRFVIDDVRPADARATFAVASVRLRFVAPPEVFEVLRAGDIEVGASGVVPEADRAVLTQIGTDREALTAVITNDVVSPDEVVRRSLQFRQPVVAFTGTVRIPVVSTADGWTHKGRPIKVGAGFMFEATAGAMTGLILDVKVSPER